MSRIILLLIAVTIGLAARADYTVTTQQPWYQGAAYSMSQPYSQTTDTQAYNQTYPQQYNQSYFQNPYQTQCQVPYVNPYQYRNPYSYGTNLPYGAVNSALTGLGSTGNSSIVKNIGQSMLFSLMRGY